MDIPTAAQIREWSDVDFDSLGNGFLSRGTNLQRLINTQAQFLEWATGQTFAAMPTGFTSLAEQAMIWLTENAAQQSTADISETMGDWALIQSFSAGPYSESRRSMDELRKSGLIVGDPRIHGLLWAMLTDDRRDAWLEWLTGVIAPAFEVTEVDWQGTYDPLLPQARGVWADEVYPY